MEHTHSPWAVINGSVYQGKCRIALMDRIEPLTRPSERDANAARIVACVNACEGINPDAVPGLLAACSALLEAVEGHERRTGNVQMHPAIDTARAALAKAEKGA